MKMFRICGYSSGRSALVSRLVEELSFRKIEIAVIKHAHKPFDMDKVGSDTYNLRQIGCRQTLIASRDRWGLLCETPALPVPDPVVLAGHLAECELVLAVGFDNLALPGLEVMRADSTTDPLYQRDAHLQTIVTDAAHAALPQGILFSFTHGDVEDIATHILDRAVLLPRFNGLPA